ncbi:MAG: ABC transporter permease [Holophagales bacterium]|nr:ABC transporter permease [Holophagales bacterium]
MSEAPGSADGRRLPPPDRRDSLRARLDLVVEVVRGGLLELWAHKLRSVLTLTLLMLGVFTLVVLTSVIDGVIDKVRTGFSGLAWDGTAVLQVREPKTTDDQKRFAMSPGLRFDDLARLTTPHAKVTAFLPRATKRTAVRVAGGTERAFVTGVTPDYAVFMNRPVGLGRGLTADDARRRSTVAVVGATLASKLFGGADPVGRDVVIEGVPWRIVGVTAPLMIFSEELYYDANGLMVPLETYVVRIDPNRKLTHLAVKLKARTDLEDVSSALLSRARQAHHGIEDTEIKDLDAEAAKSYSQFMEEMRSWRVVLTSLAGTVLLVGGVGVLSVMLISYSSRRYEIGLRKAMGASDAEILFQFLLEALVLASLGALLGTVGGAFLCQKLSHFFPWGLVVNPLGLVTAWGVALGLALVFGLYPALRAAKLSPMEAMR